MCAVCGDPGSTQAELTLLSSLTGFPLFGWFAYMVRKYRSKLRDMAGRWWGPHKKQEEK